MKQLELSVGHLTSLVPRAGLVMRVIMNMRPMRAVAARLHSKLRSMACFLPCTADLLLMEHDALMKSALILTSS
jgi:hypothetical protein